MTIKLFVIPNEEGDVLSYAAGENLVINAELGLYFEVESWDTVNNIQNYKVEGGRLVEKLQE